MVFVNHLTRSITTLIILLLFITINCHALSTPAQNICANSKGQLALRSKCKTIERLFVTGLLPLEASSAAAGATGPTGPQGIQGAQGPQGAAGWMGPMGINGKRGVIDFSACRAANATSDSNIFDLTKTTLVGTVACNSSTEFLFDYSFSTDATPAGAGTKGYLQAVFISTSSAGDNTSLPYQADVTINRAISGGNGTFVVITSGICCPR